MKKGFTLVELLGIIILLGLIIMILIPGVTEIINKGKRKAFEVNVKSYIKAANTDNSDKSQINGSYFLENGNLINNSDDESVEIETTYKDEKGYLYIDEKGNKYGSFYNSKYCATINKNKIRVNEGCKFNIYENGYEIYYNPEINSICSLNELNQEQAAKTGCLKWHIFNDKKENSYVNMILDHDTSYNIPYNSTNNTNEMVEAKQVLISDSSTWAAYVNPRLISAKEITEITGFNFNNLADYYNLASNKAEENILMEAGTNPYKWLFNYTSGCRQHGCDYELGNTWGYWTSTPKNETKVWHIRPDGTLHSRNTAEDVSKGIRPVITIPKYVLEK
jgi:type IV pilus assembly protein PilA